MNIRLPHSQVGLNTQCLHGLKPGWKCHCLELNLNVTSNILKYSLTSDQWTRLQRMSSYCYSKVNPASRPQNVSFLLFCVWESTNIASFEYPALSGSSLHLKQHIKPLINEVLHLFSFTKWIHTIFSARLINNMQTVRHFKIDTFLTP